MGAKGYRFFRKSRSISDALSEELETRLLSSTNIAGNKNRCISKRSISGSLLEELETKLLLMYKALNDAEEKLLEGHVVEEWLSKLIKATFDAQPLIDEIKRELRAEAMERELLQLQSEHTSSFLTSNTASGNADFSNTTSRNALLAKVEDFFGRLKQLKQFIVCYLGLNEQDYTFEVMTSAVKQSLKNIEPTIWMREHLMSLLSRLFQGCCPRKNRFYFVIYLRILSRWFFHHSPGDIAVCYLPPNLHDDEKWVGLELYVVIKCRLPLEGTPSKLAVDIYAHGTSTVHIITYPLILRDGYFGAFSIVSHVPRICFPKELNQCRGISVCFTPITQNIEVEICGTKLLYEKDSELLMNVIVDSAKERGDLWLLYEQIKIYVKDETGSRKAMEQRSSHSDSFISHEQPKVCPEDGTFEHDELEEGYYSLFGSGLVDSLEELFSSADQLVEETIPNLLETSRLSLAPMGGYKKFDSIFLHSKHLFLNDWDCIQETTGDSGYGFKHLHVMIETLVETSCSKYRKKDLNILLEEFFRGSVFVTLSARGRIISVLKHFDPYSTYNFCFPRKEILGWFEHQSSMHTAKIEIPAHLSDDSDWRGLLICASFSVDDHQNSSQETSLKLLCHLTTDECQVNVVPTFHVTKEEFKWSYTRGFIWVTYVPRALLPELNEQRSLEARISSCCPHLTLRTCGIRLLYQQDVEEFKQAIIHCWTSYFDNLETICQFVKDIDKFRQDKFDSAFMYDLCFRDPFTDEHQKWFSVHFKDLSASTCRLSSDPKINLNNWLGLALYAHFREPEKPETTSYDGSDPEIPKYLTSCFKNEMTGQEYIHEYLATGEELNWLREGGFVWLSYLPRSWVLKDTQAAYQLHQHRIMDVYFRSNTRVLPAHHLGIRLVYSDNVEEFQEIIKQCRASMNEA
ncbi:hypothetical protein TorRG33x02_248180 [Trema orientale]|uniref:Uncharacterized protein n=1 Tax=Trema orientale TaxID=63057 RepID=A0A2P5DL79_TREOI|nr:hypothetical protein TorRG33x02_248180 [Trema orientale]